MSTYDVSIVIRTLNEKEELGQIIEASSKQDFSGKTEVIVVDNESSDGMKEFAEKHGAKVITIKKDDFTFPKSMNVGIKEAKYPVVILTVGHALPVNAEWINSAAKHFSESKVAGVYSTVIPKKPYSISEFFLYYPGFIFNKMRGPFAVKKVGKGVFGATNLAIRKSLWEEHHFEEKYELGGEDTHWAEWALSRGYEIICDTSFAVRHSHHLNFFCNNYSYR